MLSWRAKRQLIIASIPVLLILGLGFLFFQRFLPEPTCFDNKKNQGELGVDCGGPCGPCELKNPKSVEIFWARAVLARPQMYDVAAEVRNSNEVLYSPDMEYEFTLFDEFGLIARKAGRTFILPQERTHVIEANLNTTREPSRVEFKILNIDWQFKKLEQPNLVIERRDYKIIEIDGKKQSLVEASVLNKTPFNFREIVVNFAVLDAEGNLLGANRVLVESLLAGSRQTVKSIWPQELKGRATTIIVEPRVNFFDPTIIIKPR